MKTRFRPPTTALFGISYASFQGSPVMLTHAWHADSVFRNVDVLSRCERFSSFPVPQAWEPRRDYCSNATSPQRYACLFLLTNVDTPPIHRSRPSVASITLDSLGAQDNRASRENPTTRTETTIYQLRIRRLSSTCHSWSPAQGR